MILIVVGGTVQLISGITSALLIPWTRENAPGLVLFGLCMMDMMFLLLVCVGAMAAIYHDFEDVLSKMRGRMILHNRGGQVMNSKLIKRLCWSYTPVKFKFAQINFIDRMTPLNCMMFAIDQSVSLLLL